MWHTLEIGEILKKLRSDLNTGIKEEQIEKIRQVYGENKLLDEKKETIFIKFIN